VVIGVPLGLVVGRLGCYCRGCCYGKITDVYWAVTFPKHIDITGYVVGSPTYLHHLNQGLISKMDISSLPVHPAQIYSSLASLIIFVIMLYMWKTKRFSGQLFFIYLIIYSISRFILEIFRDNELAFKNITIPQVISIFVLILGISGFIYQRWCMPYFRK
jgi:phosphatidylglycerol:prolipoprotein diacylglycerol transferase